MNFLAELKRRNVIRMAGLYLVGAWLITQVAGTILPMFDAPDWVARTVVVLLVIGFIPALIISWVFELTPDGLRREDEISEPDSIAPETAQRMNRMIMVVMALALGYFAFDKFVLAPSRDSARAQAAQVNDQPSSASPVTASQPEPAKAIDAKSIAVLAFANMSADRDNEYFSDGVAEEILNALAKIDDLKVAGRTSSFYFKGRNETLAAIGNTLGVAHVLEGSVRKQGDRLRISAKLLRVSDGVEMWTETFNGTDADIFALQESIAQQVTSQLKVALNAGQGNQLVDAGTTNPIAYALYLRATDVFNRRAGGEFLNAIKLLEEAVALDPTFARAYSRLGALHTLTPEYLNVPHRTANEAATVNARRALELQPRLAEPHAVIAHALQRQFRFTDARAEYEQALANDPMDVISNFWFAAALGQAGYGRARAARLERVLELDPLMPNALNHYGFVLEQQGDLDRARTTLERAKELGAANTDIFLGIVSLRQGRTTEARAELERGIDTFGANLPPGAGATIAAGVIEDGEARARALALVRSLVAQPDYADFGILAYALSLLGAPDEALAMIAKQPMNSSVWNQGIWGSTGQAARTSPAFPEFARKGGFAALWDKYGPPDLCKKDVSGDYRCK